MKQLNSFNMKTCGALLVLLSCCLAEPESQPDTHTGLGELIALLSELKVELTNTKTQMGTMEIRLKASEVKSQTMEIRLRASERTVEEQKAVIKELKEKQEEQAASVSLMGSQVADVRKTREEEKVSFSASLIASGDAHTALFNADTTLVYRHVITNIGNAYNPNTGIFTAPVRGVYIFTYHAFADGHPSLPAAVFLYKNTQRIVIAYGAGNIYHVGASNGASLLLEVGDVVYLRLRANARVRDNSDHHTTFTGYLLFTM